MADKKDIVYKIIKHDFYLKERGTKYFASYTKEGGVQWGSGDIGRPNHGEVIGEFILYGNRIEYSFYDDHGNQLTEDQN